MRIVCWNVRKSLHKKVDLLTDLHPDIAILSEVASPEVLESKGRNSLAEQMEWAGTNPESGLGVVGFGGAKVSPASEQRDRRRYIFPLQVSTHNSAVHFNLLASWPRRDRGNPKPSEMVPPLSDDCYLLSSALKTYDQWLRSAPTVVAGDFNNSVNFKKVPKSSPRNHQLSLTMLDDIGLVSAYHEFKQEEQGSETKNTFFQHFQTIKQSHIDYCFIPKAWIPALTNVEVGSFADWVGNRISDHVPLIVDLDEAILAAVVTK